mmetsp:Transcript_75115/g.190518  ORF Transcript_75115/g.190518 Transcript_75115/m.190518 type:complete len:256 (-) Transcript_75115:51-818(-)
MHAVAPTVQSPNSPTTPAAGATAVPSVATSAAPEGSSVRLWRHAVQKPSPASSAAQGRGEEQPRHSTRRPSSAIAPLEALVCTGGPATKIGLPPSVPPPPVQTWDGAAAPTMTLPFSLPSFVFPAAKLAFCCSASSWTQRGMLSNFGPSPAFASAVSARREASARRRCVRQSSACVSAFLNSAATSTSSLGCDKRLAMTSVLRLTALFWGFHNSPAARFFSSNRKRCSSPKRWSGICTFSGCSSRLPQVKMCITV